ncbi:MAG: DMT family transporter [Proteobacteria bacterium]|nr:DMT family transporter [Pseudomonadota bacterium]MDA1355212.1 DMT family transporter [Pseudomonadota bacterium]
MSITAAHVIAVLGMFFIATIFSVGDEIADSMPAGVLMTLRFGTAALLFTPYILWRHGIRWPGLSGLWRYGLLSLLSTIFFWSMFEGLKYTDSLNTSAISTTILGFTAIYGAILMRERLGRYRFAALLIGLVGTLWVIFRGDPERLVALELNRGDALFFAGCISMGLYAALIPKLYRGEPVAVMSFWIMVMVTVLFVAVANVEFAEVPWGTIDGSVWGALAWLAIGPTMLTFFMIQSTSLVIGATRVQSYSYLIPAFVLVFDWALGRGLPTAMTIPGIVIVVLATLVIQRGVLAESGEPAPAKS